MDSYLREIDNLFGIWFREVVPGAVPIAVKGRGLGGA